MPFPRRKLFRLAGTSFPVDQNFHDFPVPGRSRIDGWTRKFPEACLSAFF
jgi:hypothetical protein